MVSNSGILCNDSSASTSKCEPRGHAGIQFVTSGVKNIKLEHGSSICRHIGVQKIGGCIHATHFEKWKQLCSWSAINGDNNIICDVCSKVKSLGLHKDKIVHLENAFIEGVQAKSRKELDDKITVQTKSRHHGIGHSKLWDSEALNKCSIQFVGGKESCETWSYK